MKKLICVFMLLTCFVLTACGGPNAKEEAQQLNKEIYTPLIQLYADNSASIAAFIDGDLAKDNEAVFLQKINEEYFPKLTDLEAKFTKNNKEAANKEVKDLHSLIKMQLNNEKDLFKLLADSSEADKKYWKNDCANLMRNIFDTDLKVKNELSLAVNNKPAYDLSLSNFQKIHKGKSYTEVAEIFQMPGELKSSKQSGIKILGYRTVEEYVWEHNGATVKVTFDNDKAYLIEQEGLK